MTLPEGWPLRLPLVVVVTSLGLGAFAGEPDAPSPAAAPSEAKVEASESHAGHVLDEPSSVAADARGPQPDALGLILHGTQEAPGTFGDPLRAVLLLPGVTHLASGVAHPVIRGFQPATSQLRIDGVKVPMQFHLLAGPSTINPDFLGRVQLLSGATPVEYGRQLGAVLEAQTAEGPDRLVAGIDLLNVSAAWSETIEATRTQLLVSGRVGYSPLLAGAIYSAASSSTDVSAQIYDYQARVTQRIAAGELRLLALGASTSGGLVGANRGDTIAPYDTYHRLDLRLRYPFGASGKVTVAATWGMDRFGIGVGGGNVFGLEARDAMAAVRASVVTKVLPALEVELGGDLERRDPQTVQRTESIAPEVPGFPTPEPIITTVRQTLGPALLGGAYVRGAYTLAGEKSYWLIEPSFRFDTYSVGTRAPLYTYEPRLAVQYVIGPSTFAVTGGLYHQLPTTLVDFPTAELARAGMGLQQVVKLDGSVTHTLNSRLRGRVAVFANPIRRAIELSPFDPHFQQQLSWDTEVTTAMLLENRVERGFSAGVEAFVYAEPITGLSGWLSYTFTKSLRNTRFVAVVDPPAIPPAQLLASPLEREHVLDLVGRYELPSGWSFGANLHFNSGFPEAGNVASYTHEEGTNSEGHPDWIPVPRNEVGRMPFYWRIDARVAKTWAMKGWSLQAYLDILNLSVNQEVLRVTYNERAETQEDRLEGNFTLERGAMRYPVILPMLGLRAQL